MEARCFFRHHLCNKNQSLDADNAADEPAVKEGKVTAGGKYAPYFILQLFSSLYVMPLLLSDYIGRWQRQSLL